MTYSGDFGLDPLPEGLGVIGILHGQSVPYTDHAVPDPQRQAAGGYRREAKRVNEASHGG